MGISRPVGLVLVVAFFGAAALGPEGCKEFGRKGMTGVINTVKGAGEAIDEARQNNAQSAPVPASQPASPPVFVETLPEPTYER